MLKLLLGINKYTFVNRRCYSTAKECSKQPQQQIASIYEPVFSFPFIKYVAIVNRLKVYQITGTTLAMPGCALMEIFNVLPEGAFYIAAYIGEPAPNLIEQ